MVKGGDPVVRIEVGDDAINGWRESTQVNDTNGINARDNEVCPQGNTLSPFLPDFP